MSIVHRELPGNLESTNLSRDRLSRENGRTARFQAFNLEEWAPGRFELWGRAF